MTGPVFSRRGVRMLALAALAALGSVSASAQTPNPPAPSQGQAPAAAPITALVEDLLGMFPKVQGEVLEVRGPTLTLGTGRKDGARPGLEIELYREGREIKHPKTGEVLGKSEEVIGRTRVTEVQENFSSAADPKPGDVKPGDRFRVSGAKVNLVLLPLLGGMRESLAEAAIQDLIERLAASGRFRVTMGDAINVYLSQQNIKPTEFLDGKGVKDAAQRFQADNLLAVYFRRVQNKPYMEVRFFAQPRADPEINTAFFVPSTIKPASAGGRFSAGGPANPPQAKPKSLLARLLGGDLESGTYSSGESAIPLRLVARFSYPVLALDVSISPKDKIPRMIVSDGDQLYMYRIVDQKFEPEWTKSVRSLGRVFSVQLADVNGDGELDVIANRFATRTGLSSFILSARDKNPQFLVEDVSEFLFAVDLVGDGVKRTLWTQRYSGDTFFTPGQAEQVVLKDGKLLVDKTVRVPQGFRPMGAALCNIMGKDTRSLAFIDEFNRIQISTEGEDLWRSSTSVGGGYMTVEQQYGGGRDLRSRFFKIEPTPLAVDLDGDGIEELLVPQNLVKEGLLAVVFKGPAGFRLQSIDTGFEGGITALGAFKGEETTQPTIFAAVVRFNNFMKTAGETQIIMTVPQE
jgi:hypothetical protein